MSESPNTLSEFDKVSSNYENQLNCGISLSGEDSSFFAKKRVEHMLQINKRFNPAHEIIMDYGCGTGGSVGYLLNAFNPKKLIAVDVSEDSLSILKSSYNTQQVIAKSPSSLKPDSSYDLCFCNGVFHHILPRDRQYTAKIIYDSLQSGGYFYFWENNPWNPATHWVMSRIPFDHNAVKIFPHQAVKLLQKVGFKVKLIHYLFIFPKFLSFLRPMEKLLRRFPLGCQYLILVQKI
ncbi:MAG: class I SAM-dependent methyltransferase [Verrucomicrobiota bacterium]|nr:class I SAM-dependent methyltransferase [Verrucomicrobiota bacterium]